jgi:hypothetical protein
MTTGYLHPQYAESLSEFGTPYRLARCGGWVLKRRIPETSDYDAMGCYPLFACQNWRQLHRDLDEIEGGLVSVALVTDPFGGYDEAYLRRCFNDAVIPFKEHFVVDLNRPVNISSSSHQRYARRSLREVEIELCPEPQQHLDEWADLYSNLIKRHNIRGLAAFSRTSFAGQLKVPGLLMFRARHGPTTVGMSLWYVQGEVAYYHLAAWSDLGYSLRASYAMFWMVIQHFAAAGNVRWLNLGAGAGLKTDAADGLTRFKRGWATGTRTAYFCGRILDPARYEEIARAKGASAANYFPAYRQGEFGPRPGAA